MNKIRVSNSSTRKNFPNILSFDPPVLVTNFHNAMPQCFWWYCALNQICVSVCWYGWEGARGGSSNGPSNEECYNENILWDDFPSQIHIFKIQSENMAAGPDGAILQADIWFPSDSDLFLQTEKLSQNRSQGTLTSIIWAAVKCKQRFNDFARGRTNSH